jgi:hypothetical protein
MSKHRNNVEAANVYADEAALQAEAARIEAEYALAEAEQAEAKQAAEQAELEAAHLAEQALQAELQAAVQAQAVTEAAEAKRLALLAKHYPVAYAAHLAKLATSKTARIARSGKVRDGFGSDVASQAGRINAQFAAMGATTSSALHKALQVAGNNFDKNRVYTHLQALCNKGFADVVSGLYFATASIVDGNPIADEADDAEPTS